MALNILKQTGVATTPGTAFGCEGEGYLRLSYAVSEEVLLRAVKKLNEFLNHSPKTIQAFNDSC